MASRGCSSDDGACLRTPYGRSIVSSIVTSLDSEGDGDSRREEDGPMPVTPIALLEAMSALQTADAHLRWRLRDRLQLRANEISALEFVARLGRLGQPVRALDIARALGVTSGASTIIVSRMMDRGLLSRTDNPRDGRGHLLYLTPAAKAEFSAALGDSRDDVRALLAGLSPRESKRIITLLSAMTASLDLGGILPAA